MHGEQFIFTSLSEETRRGAVIWLVAGGVTGMGS